MRTRKISILEGIVIAVMLMIILMMIADLDAACMSAAIKKSPFLIAACTACAALNKARSQQAFERFVRRAYERSTKTVSYVVFKRHNMALKYLTKDERQEFVYLREVIGRR